MCNLGAVAVDLGATSARFAAGWIEDGEVRYEIIEQIPHSPFEADGRLVWDLDALINLTKRAAQYASDHFQISTLGVDCWGVDHGFVDPIGQLIQPPVCYRDESHARVYSEMQALRPELYRLTGIQHQPFNTIYQLIARRQEDPSLMDARWLNMPDLIGLLLTGEANMEITMASTTQLMGRDNQWSPEAFAIAGWPMPELSPAMPGQRGGYVADRVRWMTVGSHDTASAVRGLGPIGEDALFLNIGTWSLIGCVIDQPLVSAEAENGNYTNERTTDGRVRLLKNLPGFYVINRLHEELGILSDVPGWLATANLSVDERLDLSDEVLFNPASMLSACEKMIGKSLNPESWAGVAMSSLADAISEVPSELGRLTDRTFREVVIGGGGARSQTLRHLISQQTGLNIRIGDSEASVLGNLQTQLQGIS